MNLSILLIVISGVIAGMLGGALLHFGWLRYKAKINANMRLPDKWPLVARDLVTPDEYQVWQWLRVVFHEHMVLVKIPVSRFTLPLDKGKNRQENQPWLDLLHGVYPTFTVCTTQGKVLGCVDVLGKRALSKASQELKESLLSDCHIAYTCVRSSNLPDRNALRAAFLGEIPADLVEENQLTRGGSSSFIADLDAFPHQKNR